MREIHKRRIATVTATGRRFVVDRLQIDPAGAVRVFCFGPVIRATATPNGGARWVYAEPLAFDGGDVTVEPERPLTFELIRELWWEDLEVLAARNGNLVRVHVTRGGTHRPVEYAAGAEVLLSRAATAEQFGKLELSRALFAAAERAA
jgi:hypothetical protein